MSKQKLINDNLQKIKALLSEHVPLLSISKEIGVKYQTLIKYLKLYNIEYNTNQCKKGFSTVKKCVDLQDIFENKKPITSSIFRDRLIREGYKEYKCECCGNTEWIGEPIPLEVHHKNGNHYDNRLDNVEIICSNCHSVKHKYGVNIPYKNKKKSISETISDVNDNILHKNKKKSISETISYVNDNIIQQEHAKCSICGKEISTDTKTGKCQDCLHYEQRKTEWPSREELIELLSTSSKSKISKIYGVSEASIRRWVKHYNITDTDITNI